MNKWIGLTALLLALAVILGAFGAHGLRTRLDAYSLEIWEKAVFYHFVHALGMLLVISLTPMIGMAAASRVCLLLLLGLAFFSGSLYALALGGSRWLGAITPLGGMFFILSWLLLAWSSFRR